MFRKHGWFICLMGLVLLLAALDGFCAAPRGTKTRGIYIAEDLGAATSWDDVVWIKRDSSGSLIWADATHTTSTFSASSVWQRVQPWVFLIDTSDRLGLGLTSATVRLDMKSLGATTTTARIEEFGTTLSAVTLGTDSEAGVLGLFDGSGSSSVSLSGKPGEAQFFNTGGDFGVGVVSPSDFVHFYRSVNGPPMVLAENPNSGASASMRYRAAAEATSLEITAYSDAFGAPFGGNTALLSLGGKLLVVSFENDEDIEFMTRTGSVSFVRATISGTTGTMTLADDLRVDGGDIGITADPDLLQLANGAGTVNGNWTVTSLLKGSRQSVTFSRLASTGALDSSGTTASLKFGEVDSWDKGAPMARPGSVLSVSCGYDVTGRTGDDDDDDDDTDNLLLLKVLKNDVELFEMELDNVDSVQNAVTLTQTEARNDNVFSAGDRISVVILGDGDGTVTLANIGVLVEVVYDD